VAGWPLSPELLTAAAQLPAGEIDPIVARLRHAHLVRAASGTRKGAIEPYHDRVREAVLDHLAPEPRRACHRALAGALLAAAAASDASRASRDPEAAPPGSSDAWWGPEAIGVHLQAAGEIEQAARYLVLAADQAAAALAFDRAARLYRQALAFHDQSGASPGPLGDTRDVLARLARALVNARRGGEAAAIYLELARLAEAAGEEDLELRLRGAEQLLSSGHRDEGRRVFAGVLDELDLSPPVTRVGALGGLLWRRSWVRLRGFGAAARGRRAAKREPTPRELLRLEACWVAWMATDVPLEYLTRYQALALKTGDLRCSGLALIVEINITVVMGAAAAPRTARLLDELAAAAEQSADPYLLGREQSARSLIGLELGRWERGRDHGARAVQIFRERCLGASYETANAAVQYFSSLFYMGDYSRLTRELQPLLREAAERGEHLTPVTLQAFVTLVLLTQDEPEAARQQVERGMAVWTTIEVDVRLAAGQFAHAQVDLYEGNGAAAYRRADQDWCRMMALPVMRLAYLRARAFTVHGLAALAACRSGSPERRLVRVAARDARGLRAMRMPWTCALARVLDIGVALATGDRTQGLAQLERAHAELAAAGMSLHAALARRRLGERDGGAAGARVVAEADAWLAAQGVRAPERLARLFMPEVA